MKSKSGRSHDDMLAQQMQKHHDIFTQYQQLYEEMVFKLVESNIFILCDFSSYQVKRIPAFVTAAHFLQIQLF